MPTNAKLLSEIFNPTRFKLCENKIPTIAPVNNDGAIIPPIPPAFIVIDVANAFNTNIETKKK